MNDVAARGGSLGEGSSEEQLRRPTDAEIVAAAAAHDWVIDRDELAALGVTRAQRRRLTGPGGLLQPVTSRVFAVAESRSKLAVTTLLRAALLHTGSGAVVAGQTAAALWSDEEPGQPFRLLRPHGHRRRSTTDLALVATSRSLGGSDTVTTYRDFPLTSPTRTLLDLASADCDTAALDATLQGFARQGLVDTRRLDAYLALPRVQHHPNRHRLTAAVNRHRHRAEAESILEDRLIDLLRQAGIARPRTQVWFAIDGHRYRVDVLFELHGLIVELKGHGSHATRKELADDAAREARLMSAGFRLISFTRDQLYDRPEEVIHLLRTNLDACRRLSSNNGNSEAA